MDWTCAKETPTPSAVPSRCGGRSIDGPVCSVKPPSPASQPPPPPPPTSLSSPSSIGCSAKSICKRILACSTPSLLVCISLIFLTLVILFLVLDTIGQERRQRETTLPAPSDVE